MVARLKEKAGHFRLARMHVAKGLVFRVVVVLGCDENVIPSLERVEHLGDEADLDLILERERHLLFVACTRTRVHLWVNGVQPVSEFLGVFTKGEG